MIENFFSKVEKQASKNGMIFDFGKFEAIYFIIQKYFYGLNIKLLSLLLQKYNICKRFVRLVKRKH